MLSYNSSKNSITYTEQKQSKLINIIFKRLNLVTEKNSGITIKNVKNVTAQKTSKIFLGIFNGLQILYNSLKVIKPVRLTMTIR